MFKTVTLQGGFLVAGLLIAGCMTGFEMLGDLNRNADPLVEDTVAKAEQVAQRIGGTEGFGGPQMSGYRGHFGPMMGFNGMADLADADDQFQVRLQNRSDSVCTFQVAYVASHADLEEQFMQVTVGARETVDVDLPCAEIVGMGSLTVVGTPACEFVDGESFGNEFCVPGFMHSDYECGGRYECFFGPDVDDVDGDGDTEELIATTEALHAHFGPGGMMGHHHGMGG
jgi:hypothetical protein